MTGERCLYGVQFGTSRQSFDRFDASPLRLYREHKTGPHARSVDQNGTGAADAMFASQMRAGETQCLAQKIGEIDPRLDLRYDGLAVDSEGNVMKLRHAS